MAEIELSIDASKTVAPLRDVAENLDAISQASTETGKELSKAFNRSTDAVDNTNDALDDNVKSQKKAGEATDKLKKETVDFAKKSKNAYKDDEVDDYTKSVKKADDAVDELGDSVDDLGDSKGFEGIKEGLGDVSDGFGEIGSSIASGDAGGIQGGLTGILGKLGPIGIAAGAIVGTVGALGSKIVEIDQKFDELRGTVKSLFDTTADEVDRIVVNVEAIAQTFDQDVNEVLLSTNALAKEFGISGKEASDLLAAGFNSAANAQDDLTDSVSEFAAQIRASGGDADDLFKILELSNKEGIFSDKGVDVVKEFGLRIREQADGTRDALQGAFGSEFTDQLLADIDSGAISSIDALALVSEELGGLEENSKEAQTVIADVFGGAGEDAGFRFLTLLKDINDETGFQNRQLTEEQQRKKETLDANKRLAAAQNELSKAVGDSSKIGRVWIDIQTFFVEALTAVVTEVEEWIDAFSDADKFLEKSADTILAIIDPFGLLTENVNRQTSGWNELTEEEKKNVAVKREATLAIRKYGTETAILTDKLNKSFDALAEGTLTDEKRLEVVSELNEQYPEQIGNVDLLTASETELLKIKQDIIRAEVEGDIARKKRFALAQLELQLEQRRAQLQNVQSEEQRARLLNELAVFEEQAKERIDLVEEEIRIQVGLEQRANDEIVEDAELTEEELDEIKRQGAANREKIQSDFNKAIQDIIRRGTEAELNEQTVSQEERLKRQRDFQVAQLDALLENARSLNEQLNGTRELEQNVIDKFNIAKEQLEIKFQDQIKKVRDDARRAERAEQLRFDNDVLKSKQDRFQQELDLADLQLREEIALIEQAVQQKGESEEEFERRKQLDILDAQQFFLRQRIDLIDQERVLKVNALNLELEAIAEKEGAEFELKRANLEAKRDLIEQETDTQKAELDLQLKNTEDNIAKLSATVGPTLGDVFGDIQGALADAFNLSPEQLRAVGDALQQVAGEIFNLIQDSLQTQLEANDDVIAQLEERESKVQESLEREIEAQNAGYANNVAGKKAELAAIQEQEELAQQKRRELLAEQEKLDTISQTISLITASANLYKTLSPLPFGVGIALATLLTAGMFATFAATKAKARSATQLEKGGSGDSTGMVQGSRHQHGGESFLDHVEVEDGEMWSVYNRKGSNKYKDMIKDFTNAVNTDNLDSFFPNNEVPEILISKKNQVRQNEIVLKSSLISDDMKSHLEVLPSIKDSLEKHFSAPKQHIYNDGKNTYIVTTHPNGSKSRLKLRDK